MKLQDMIKSIDPALRADAEALLKSDDFFSLKDFEDGYEAFISIEDDILLPEIVLDEDQFIQEYSCSCGCSTVNDICVHIAAILLGIEQMLAAGCDDYHEAVAKLKHH